MTTAARLAALEKEYEEREERGEHIAENGYAAPGLQQRLHMQRIRTGKVGAIPDTRGGSMGALMGSDPNDPFAGIDPDPKAPQIWRAVATPWRAPSHHDEATPVEIPPSVDPKLQLHVPVKGSPRGDAQAERITELGSVEALEQEREILRSARGGILDGRTQRSRREINDRWAGVARGGRATPPRSRVEPLLDARGKFISADMAEDWISSIERGGQGGAKDNWGGARHDFSRIQRAASGTEGLVDENVTNLLDGLKQAEAEGQRQIAEARWRKMVGEEDGPGHELGDGQDVLPQGCWALTLSLKSISDVPKVDPRAIDPHDYHSKPHLNVYCEISSSAPAVGGGRHFHRWEPVHDDDLREQQQADGIHNNVAVYDGIERGAPIRWTFDPSWGGHNLEMCIYHWPQQALDAFAGKAHRREYSKWDSWGVPTHAADGRKINQTFRSRLREDMAAVAAKYPKILLGKCTMGLEWFREAGKTGVFNLFDQGQHLTYGGKIAAVELRLEPTLPRAHTAAELKSMLLRRLRTARARAFSSTPVPVARPFMPSRGPSRWGVATAASSGATPGGEASHESAERIARSPASSAHPVQVLTVSVDDSLDADAADTELLSHRSPSDDALPVSPSPVSPSNVGRHVMFARGVTAMAASDGGHDGTDMGAQDASRRLATAPDSDSSCQPPRSSRSEKSVMFSQDHRGNCSGGGRHLRSAIEGQDDGAGETVSAGDRLRSALRPTGAVSATETEESLETSNEAHDGVLWRHAKTLMSSLKGEAEAGAREGLAGSLQREQVRSSVGVLEAPEDPEVVIGEIHLQTPVEGGWGFEARGSTEMPTGLFYHFGTWARSQAFENPALQVGSLAGSSMVRVSSSSPWSRGRPEYVAGRDATPCVSHNEQQAWICVELPPGCALYPTAYTLRHGLAGPGRAPRCWELQGSADGKRWVPLRSHHDDWALHSVKLVSSDPTAATEGSDAPSLKGGFGGFASCTFNLGEKMETVVGGIVDEDKWASLQEVKARNAALDSMLAATEGFRFLRVMLTGNDGSGSSTLACSGLEFFGRVVLRSGPILRLLKAAAVAKSPQLGALVRTLRIIRLWCAKAPSSCPEDVVRAIERLAQHAHPEVKAEVWSTLALVGPRPAIQYDEKTLIYSCQGDAIEPVRPVLTTGTLPRAFSVHPPLPEGLEIMAESGIVWGTAGKACRRTSHTVEMTCASGTATATIEVHVLPQLLCCGATFRYVEPKAPLHAAEGASDDAPQDSATATREEPSSMKGGPGSVGLVDWLSTNGLLCPYENPAASGAIRLSSSDWLTDLEFVVGDMGRLSSSHSKKDSWFALELPKGLWLLPRRYSLRHGFSSSANALRHWELQGSADGEHWVCLRSHVDDRTLDSRFAVGTWGVGYGSKARAREGHAGGDVHLDATGVHRFFRVFMTGTNSSKGRELRCSGFEIYGEIFVDSPVQTMTSPLWYLRNWALESMLNSLLVQRARMVGDDCDDESATGKQVPSLAATVAAMWREMRVDAAGFKEQVADMAVSDSAPDLRVAALGTMSILSSTSKDAGASPPEWIQSALQCLEASDAMVREAALVALESLVPPADPALISQLLGRVYQHHLHPLAGATGDPVSATAPPLVGSSQLGGGGLGAGRRAGNGMGMLGARPPGQSLKDSIIPAAAPSRPWRQTGIGSNAPAPCAATEVENEDALKADGKGQRSASEMLLQGLGVLTGGGGMDQMRELLSAGANSRRPAYGRRRLEVSLPPLDSVRGPSLWFVRDALLEVMAHTCERGDAMAQEAALEFLSDPSQILRRKAAALVGKVAVRGDPSTAQKLMEAVGDEDEGVRAAAARSLTQVAATDAIGQVRDLVNLAAIAGASPAKFPPEGPVTGDTNAFHAPAAPGQRLRAHYAAASSRWGVGAGVGSNDSPAGSGITGLRSLAERSRAQKDALVDAFWHLKDDVGAPISNHVVKPSGRHQFPASFEKGGDGKDSS